MSIIDKFIKNQYKELEELEDKYLSAYYSKSKSVIKRSNEIKCILLDLGMSHLQCNTICKKLQNIIVPVGTKSKIRGDLFNSIIAKEIRLCLKKLKIKNVKFDLEKKHAMFPEIPDWIIKKNNKILVGFNQIALFGGGHQLNRGSKYIMDDGMHKKLANKSIKMICVVKDIPLKHHGKAKNILIKGIINNRIFCIGGLMKLIKEYFIS